MSAGHELALALRAAYLTMHRQAEAHLAPGETTAEQFVVLAALAEEESSNQQELVRRTASDPNTLRAILVLLEGRGLVRRRQHPTDRRARSVSLTAEGRCCYERLWALGEPFRARLLGAFTADEAELLIRLLHRVAAVMSPAHGEEVLAVSEVSAPVLTGTAEDRA